MRNYFKGLYERFILSVFLWAGGKMYGAIRIQLEDRPDVPRDEREVISVTFARSQADLPQKIS